MQRTMFSQAVTSGIILTALSFSPALAAGDYITGYAGAFDVLDNETSAEFGLEYRAREFSYHIRPMIGAFVNSDGGAYGYAGFLWDVPLSDAFHLAPNFAAGAYHEGGSKDLGGTLEFRSGLELSYQLPNAGRIGVAFNHMSNAKIYDNNPGTESLVATYSIPFGSLFR